MQKGTDLESFVAARLANDDAQEALAAANAAMTPAAAEDAQADAEAALADVQMYAGMVADAYQTAHDARVEADALQTARGAAMDAYNGSAKAAFEALAGQGDR